MKYIGRRLISSLRIISYLAPSFVVIISRNSFLFSLSLLFYIQRRKVGFLKVKAKWQQLIKFMKSNLKVLRLLKWFYRIFSVWLIRIGGVPTVAEDRKEAETIQVFAWCSHFLRLIGSFDLFSQVVQRVIIVLSWLFGSLAKNDPIIIFKVLPTWLTILGCHTYY